MIKIVNHQNKIHIILSGNQNINIEEWKNIVKTCENLLVENNSPIIVEIETRINIHPFVKRVFNRYYIQTSNTIVCIAARKQKLLPQQE
tara:strand:+ start:8467 stop:8733 length:267 start_codon:yes stop_codon:yes gene_type:complete